MNYFLIAESGSTKTDWVLVEAAVGEQIRFTTCGLNPYFLSEEEACSVFTEVRQRIRPYLNGELALSGLRFYGAGCSPEKIPWMQHLLYSHFTLPSLTEVEVAGDLLAAARALCGTEPGIACILGTGSNSCYYDGEFIAEHIPSLGYILGDEGSGAVLGKQFLGDLLKRQLPDSLRDQFQERYALTLGEIIERVYREPYPNRFLAGFSPFIHEHMHLPSVKKLVKNAFASFFERNILAYQECCDACEIHCTGSIAYHFQDTLREVGHSMGLRVAKITKSPLNGLIRYHGFDLLE